MKNNKNLVEDITCGYHPEGYMIDKNAEPLDRYTQWEVPPMREWKNKKPVCFHSLPKDGWIKCDNLQKILPSIQKITFSPIGIINTPFAETTGMPIQPPGASGITGTVEIYAEFKAGLKDLNEFSHIILIYNFDKSDGYKLQMKPFLEDEIHGVFAIRAPKRPNAIGMSIVKLLDIKENILKIEGPDMLDGTPLLDIKPYIPDFDSYENANAGWQEKHKGKVRTKKSDERFSDN